MAFQKSVAVRTAELDQIESTIGVSAVLKLFSGAEPANCAAADPSGLLCTITLPSDWMNAASAGSKTKLGTWSAAASASGTIASWRIYESTATTCHMQGNTTDMTFDNTNVTSSQVVTVNTFTITAGNA
jgi:polyisoprenoid-binding protein YceI